MTGGVAVRQPYLTVGDLARASGVAPSAVRFYESHGLLTCERTAGNQRRFGKSDVCRTKVIRVAQRVGLSVAEIKALLAELPADPVLADWERLTISLMAEVNHRIRQLRSVLDEIASGEELCHLPPVDRAS
ncbi:MerR family transcriptional regulator [Nonomuraea jiangxiensis]|uniref:MerR family transcriptional regulator, redox-sensitive transcriptional activator SoxR n=1 Tax=Nonomuraea jiangxiensis TaxID=633440 RepID=A0A1G9GPD2_9ACTN|nr:MerR family transcriptional regulator [Nonomuraea jiangxiensis]SDL02365.1 MerR family transcriptional regulator, redox-sensitive transcriptional activator SoxR [Nonomuraea jiangxiensis]